MRITGAMIRIPPNASFTAGSLSIAHERSVHLVIRKSIPGRSNETIDSSNDRQYVGIAHSKNLISFLKNGNATKKSPKSNKKN